MKYIIFYKLDGKDIKEEFDSRTKMSERLVIVRSFYGVGDIQVEREFSNGDRQIL